MPFESVKGRMHGGCTNPKVALQLGLGWRLSMNDGIGVNKGEILPL